MALRETYLTPETLKRLEEELESLRRQKRQEVADRIQRAKEVGGTVDNAEYDDAKNEQSFIEGRIQDLEWKLHQVKLIPAHTSSKGVVKVGSHVVVEDEHKKRQEYTIVGVDDADPLAGKISHESPVGKALLTHHVSELVQVDTPRGSVTLKIVKIR